MAKKRLDVLLVERGLFPSREKAQAAILAGMVYLGDSRGTKAGDQVDEAAEIVVKGAALPYVSRGGLKLEKALRVFALNLSGKACLDIGASTGGFTDCMLQNGAVHVHAVVVGYGQLAWSLRSDERVTVLERTNFRYVTPEDIGVAIDFATVDVSFISLSLILPAAAAVLKPDGQMVCLVKPQFEAGREKVGKKGVVRDPAVHRDVVVACCRHAERNGFAVCGLSWSPIRGPEGNIEYLMWLSKSAADGIDVEAEATRVVTASHQEALA
jgi:23S rRNA (cytidine1920-2'-O)/16S rRNA (cytidine1409-2'-O)-methyltransferase